MDIYSVPNDRRYWVVRAESGYYYNHFREHGVVALGHLNTLAFPDTKTDQIFRPDESELTDSFYTANLKSKKQSLAVHLAQAKSFICEMNIGNWVITMDSNEVGFGRIVGHPYVDKSPLEYVNDAFNDYKTYMTFHLRRRVVWGSSVARQVLPYGLVLSMRANQTLFCLDKHREAIYHTLYPAFIYNRKLHLSARITTDEEIKNHSISGIFNLLNDIEVIGKELCKNNEIESYDTVLAGYINEGKLTITTKAQFHSPGDIWNTIQGLIDTNVDIDTCFIYIVAIYSMLFGNKKLGFDGLIDIETRQKIWALVLDRVRANNAERIVEDLKLKLPRYDTDWLEDDSSDEKNK